MFRLPLTLVLCSLGGLATSTTLADRIVLVAGGGTAAGDAPATDVKLVAPFGVDFDRAGNLFLVEMGGGERVRKVDAKGQLTTIAGTGQKGFAGDGGPAAQAQFNGMHNLAVAPSGDIYLADTWNSRVRKIDAKSGAITTVVGTGTKGFSGDGGPATQADFGNIYCVSLDPQAENLLLADLDNRRIRAVNLKTGIARTIAGNGQRGAPADGAEAAKSPLVDPRAVCADSKGNVYVLERGGHALRVVPPDGRIRTVAGNGQKGFSGDDGDARQATLSGPKHLCMDHDGSVIIADTENHVIRRWSPGDGRITRVAGSGKRGAAGMGGPPLEVELSQPHGVTIHRDGALYITDSSNHRVLKIVK
jgi:sugar lactone lactonase YvrE